MEGFFISLASGYPLHHLRARGVVDGELRATVNLELRIHLLDHPDEAHVLHDGGVHSPVNALAQLLEGIRHLRWLDENIEREVDTGAALVGNQAGLFELVHRELRAVVAGVELGCAAVHGVGAVGEGSADRIK